MIRRELCAKAAVIALGLPLAPVMPSLIAKKVDSLKEVTHEGGLCRLPNGSYLFQKGFVFDLAECLEKDRTATMTERAAARQEFREKWDTILRERR